MPHSFIQNRLSELFPGSVSGISFTPVSGGSINETYRIDFGGHSYFCKTNSAVKFPRLFNTERNGLELLGKTNVIRVPEVIDCYESGGHQMLLMEWLQEGQRTKRFWETFGQSLASLHQCRGKSFGLDEDNYMGSVPQINKESANWIEFFEHYRLRAMVDRCGALLDNSHIKSFEQLYRFLPSIFDAEEKTVLVHGDLWSGNFMCDEQEQPVLIDPAVYYGHPSVDLGMSTLFGGFHHTFYDSYQHFNSFPSNYKEQWQVCNLYPLLVHLYLFGKSYLRQIEQILGHYAK